MTTAGENLLIAQHWDTLRYTRMRGGGFLPILRRLNIGDYMYHRNNGAPCARRMLLHDNSLKGNTLHPLSFTN